MRSPPQKYGALPPPNFIYPIDEGSAEVVGRILELYSALQQNTLSINMGSKNLDEVEELIRAVKNYLKKIFPLIFS
ncbi:hypothetical protein [Pseudomonas syringae]|uniref:hypothetical protein n=1 Tax=Pseudomonas syringae TaxID=317 RepID=UPI001FCEF5B8|nr:hypothetical protein [Pseudomonas syringae]